MIVYFVPRMKSRNLIGQDDVAKIVFCTEHGNCYAIEKTDNDFIAFSTGDVARDGVLDNPEPNVMEFRRFQDIIYKSFTDINSMRLFGKILVRLAGGNSGEWRINSDDINEFTGFFSTFTSTYDFGNAYANLLRDKCGKCIRMFIERKKVSCQPFIVRMKERYDTLPPNTYQIVKRKCVDGNYIIMDEYGRNLSVPEEKLEA